MAIASVVQGTLELESGEVVELSTQKASNWLEVNNSFRYVPTGANKPYTVRKEPKRGGDYWYAYRKVAGKLHKRYIGKDAELTLAKLEEIAEALNTPQQSRVTQVTDIVTQVTELNNQQVTDTVTDNHTAERVTVLELQVQALQESLESLRGKLPGKFAEGDSSELAKPSVEVTDNELQIEVGNLKAKNKSLGQKLAEAQAENKRWEEAFNELQGERDDLDEMLRETKQQYSALLPTLNQELVSVREQLETVQAELFDAKAIITSLDPSPVVSALRLEIGKLQTELETCRQEPVAQIEPPEAANLLNQLKAKRKKSTASLADIEAILEMMGQ